MLAASWVALPTFGGVAWTPVRFNRYILVRPMAALYDRIGSGYDTTRKADPSIVGRLRALLCINNCRKYLDVGCGTGNYTIELNRLAGEWIGIDASPKMIREARKKDKGIEWNVGEVSILPYKEGTFDGASCVLAIHHFIDLEKSFSEIGRVISSGGRLVIFTALPTQLSEYWLNEYFPIALSESAKQLPKMSEIELALNEGGFQVEITEPFFITPELNDFFLYSGKQRPEIYLSSDVRKGISTFSNLASEEELKFGLEKLSKDIQSGHIYEVIREYPGEQGDYLFVQAKKSNKRL